MNARGGIFGLGLVGALLLAGGVPSSSAARAEAKCPVLSEAPPFVDYASTPKGSVINYRRISTGQGGAQQEAVDQYKVMSVKGDEVVWLRKPIKGEGRVENVTLYRAFARASGGQLAFEFDRKKFDAVWPLKAGNSTRYPVTVKHNGKELFRLMVSVCVEKRETLKVEAGSFDAQIIRITQRMTKGPDNASWDTANVRAWYVPEFGTALYVSDTLLKKGAIVRATTREAMKVKRGG